MTFHDHKPLEPLVNEKWEEFNTKHNVTIPEILQWVCSTIITIIVIIYDNDDDNNNNNRKIIIIMIMVIIIIIIVIL